MQRSEDKNNFKNMKLTKKQKECLEVIIAHTFTDITYDEGGSYVNDQGELDNEEIKKALEGIKIIKKLVI